MKFQDIEISEDGPVGWITIRRDDRLNALRMTITDGRVAQINCNSERALPEMEFRRYVQSLGGPVGSVANLLDD